MYLFLTKELINQNIDMILLATTAGLSDSLLIIIAVEEDPSLLCLYLYFKQLLYSRFNLMYMAWTIWHDTLTDGEAQITSTKQVSFALSVSLLNPHAILDTIGVIGSVII